MGWVSPGEKEKGMRVWITDSKKKSLWERDRETPWTTGKEGPRGRSQWSRRETETWASHWAGGKGPPECWTWGCENPLPRGDTLVEGNWVNTYQENTGLHLQTLQ